MNGEEGNHSHHHRSEFHNTHKGEMPCWSSFSLIHAAHQASKPPRSKPRRGISRFDRRWFWRRVSPTRSDIQQSDPSPASMSSGSSSSLFQWKIEFHPTRKPFKGFSNGGVATDFRLETLNPGGGDFDQRQLGLGQLGSQGKRGDGSEFSKNGLDPELSLGITVWKIVRGFCFLFLGFDWHVVFSSGLNFFFLILLKLIN